MSKTFQVRVSPEEHAFIKSAFRNENISKIIRDYLLQEAEERLKNSDMSLQNDDPSIKNFLEILSNPQVQQLLYKIFKSAKEES